MKKGIKSQVDSALGMFVKAVNKLESVKDQICARKISISVIQESLDAETDSLMTEEKRIDHAIGKINEIIG